MGDESSPPSRCTSPDLQGYTTAGEEVVAGESGSSGSGSSNRTVRDFSPPQLRPGAKTVPRFIWKRPLGYVKPRSDLPLPPRDSRGRCQSRQRLGGVVIGESDDSQVGSGADLLEAYASPSWAGLGSLTSTWAARRRPATGLPLHSLKHRLSNEKFLCWKPKIFFLSSLRAGRVQRLL